MSPDALLGRIGERANPVLVKEVRSALRGRAFAAGFTIVLVLAMVVSSIAMLVSTSEANETPSGVGYLVALGAVFAIGVHGFVPFSAMASMSSEHDESALELLQLSGVTPARLVLGKLGAAAVLAALLYAAFLPFVAFAFLLRGVGLVPLVLGVASSFVASLAFSSFAILLGASLKKRWLRVFGYVALAVGLMIGVQGLFGWIGFGLMGGTTFDWTDLALGAAVVILLTASFLASAVARLQHAEENRSTSFRVLGTVALLVGCAFGVGSGAVDETFTWILVGLGFAVPSMYMGVTEEERMPRAVLARARRRATPWFLAPWVPGGGRAVLLVAVNCGLALGAAVLALALGSGSRAEWTKMVGAVAAVEAWGAVALLLPTGVLAPWLRHGWARGLARIACCALPIAMIQVPAFTSFLSNSPRSAFAHAGNPQYLASQMFDHGRVDFSLGLVVMFVAFVTAVAANAPRVLRSFGEVRRSRAAAAEIPGADAQR